MSGILYPILILTLFLIVQILTMMASRKAILDKNKQQLLDSVNTSNKIYNNEELSILLAEQQSKISELESKLATSESNYTELEQQHKNDQQTVNSSFNNLKSLLNKNSHQIMNSVANLNTVDENSDRLLYFGTAAIGKPTECQYGIIENFSLGSITNPKGSYWHFQLAFCTNINAIYTRQRINNSSPDAWTSWRKY